MRSSVIADVVVFTNRPNLAKIASDNAKMKGVSNVLMPTATADCIDALDRFSKALLILDWEVGAEDAVRVLSHNRRKLASQLRPILLVAPNITDQVVTTAAEYAVSQIFTDVLTFKNLGARLAHLLLAESIPDELKTALASAHEDRAGGDFKKALATLLKLLPKHPTNLRLKCETAEVLLQLGETERALTLLTGMERTAPPCLRGIHLLGRCLMRLGRHAEALVVLEQAHNANPHDADRQVDLGQTLLHLDRIKDAAGRFESALKSDRKHRGAKVGQAECKLMEGQVNEALSILKDVSGEAEVASLFNTCAVLNMRRGRHEQGMDLYLAALKALSRNVGAQARLHFNMGIGYRRWGKRAKAQQAFEKALKLDPSFAKAQGQLAAMQAPVPAKKPEHAAADSLITPGMLGIGNFDADLADLLEEPLEETLFTG